MTTTTLNVKGMTCNHCVQAVEGALTELSGVERALVDLKAENVVVQFDDSVVTVDKMTETIEDQGYDVEA
ncbi:MULTISPECIES: copper chaperone CopZ [unclassified Sporosarcina]|uniref:copper chaperone CopZ n=1 Tax=unclassified Sporosarcina TaxID=2647733 RepID=UPI000C169ACA|nr:MULTISPECIES: copper chaperone CopZ [unclassified Sporosarcina]PIC99672.1 copper resistance protein CopZ [Sporosarcina sp. P29]PID06188.1 copper resistance protein CopZ [Sporosarcina sp. P30]PID09382.1 copper resistance protein CopZ [Sporosarcina sp. P31]PID12681.1 copper resistance protein CopZ [Sporosarcina sp. P32b]